MSEKSFEKEYKKLNEKYAGKQLHHYQNQPKFSKWESRFEVFLEWLTIIGCVAACIFMIGIIVLITVVVKSVERGCF